MLFVEKEGLEGVKYNIDFGVRGESTLGSYFHDAKRGLFIEVSQHFGPSL